MNLVGGALDHPVGPEDIAHTAAVFAAARPRLIEIAYRIVRNAADAEDVVQDVWIRWQRCDRNAVRDSRAFLATMASRLALNLAQSARVRHETCVGASLSEAVDTGGVPKFTSETSEAVRHAIQVLMTRLSPHERAVYVLREAFGYPYERIGVVLGQRPSNVRQLVSRARRRIAIDNSDQRGRNVDSSESQRLLEAFLTAGRNGNLSQLESVFDSFGQHEVA